MPSLPVLLALLQLCLKSHFQIIEVHVQACSQVVRLKGKSQLKAQRFYLFLNMPQAMIAYITASL